MSVGSTERMNYGPTPTPIVSSIRAPPWSRETTVCAWHLGRALLGPRLQRRELQERIETKTSVAVGVRGPNSSFEGVSKSGKAGTPPAYAQLEQPRKSVFSSLNAFLHCVLRRVVCTLVANRLNKSPPPCPQPLLFLSVRFYWVGKR